MEHIFLTTLFGTDEPDIISKILDDLPKRILSAGSVLYEEGEMSNELHILLNGRVEVFVKTASGMNRRLDVLHKGQLVGEMAVLDNGPRSATVRALEDSELAIIDHQHFMKLCAEIPRLPVNVASLLSSRLRMADRIIASMEQVRSSAEKIILAQQEERQRISERITSGPLKQTEDMVRCIEELCANLPEDQKVLADRLLEISSEARASNRQIKDLAQQLYPESLESSGLLPTLVSTIARFSPQLGTRLHFLRGENIPELNRPQEIALYTIALEALNNIRKHSEADNTWIRIQTEGTKYTLEVRDDGKGFKPFNSGELLCGKTLGLLFMKEQAEAIGADLKIESSPGAGTSIVLSIDMRKADA